MRTSKSLTLFILSIASLIDLGTGEPDYWNYNHKYRENVLKDYDKSVIPNHAGRNTTLVRIALSPTSAFIVEAEQKLILRTALLMIWEDDRLKYDFKDYGRLNSTHFSSDEIWVPDIYNYNSADISNEVTHHTPLIVYPTGEVIWVPRVVFHTECFIDLTYWPFDQQTCEVVLGSWTTDGWTVDLDIFNMTLDDGFKTKHHWKVISTKSYKVVTFYECCPEPYLAVHFEYVLKRYSPSYSATIAIPALSIALLMLVQFILPVDHPQRITIGCVASVMILLLLNKLSESLPPLGTSVPLIVRFYGFALFIVITSVAISGILITISHPQNPVFASPPPAFIKIILTSPVGRVLCLQNYSSKIGHAYGGDDSEAITEDKQQDYSHEWLFIAKALDRIAMILFVTIYVLALFVFIAPVH